MKTGLILEGGAYRGIFTTGVLKVLRKYGIDFDYIVGVSAGAGNIADFVSGRDDVARNFISVSRSNTSYGVKALFRTGSFLNVDNMAQDLMTMENNGAAESIMNSDSDIEIVCTNCITGRPEYLFERKSMQKLISIGKASCSVPIISKPVVVDGTPYFDGSITDAIPLKRALEDKECDKAVVVLTRKAGVRHTDYSKASLLIKNLYHEKYPEIEKVLLHRNESFEDEVRYMLRMEDEGKAFIIQPEIESIKRFEPDEAKLKNYYIHGIDRMESLMDEFRSFMEK